MLTVYTELAEYTTVYSLVCSQSSIVLNCSSTSALLHCLSIYIQTVPILMQCGYFAYPKVYFDHTQILIHVSEAHMLNTKTVRLL